MRSGAFAEQPVIPATPVASVMIARSDFVVRLNAFIVSNLQRLDIARDIPVRFCRHFRDRSPWRGADQIPSRIQRA
jgi:hypothetical protein